jgi:hypothetical protein
LRDDEPFGFHGSTSLQALLIHAIAIGPTIFHKRHWVPLARG